MESVAVQIVRFVDGRQPGWVACDLVDAAGRRHTFVDKVPWVMRTAGGGRTHSAWCRISVSSNPVPPGA